MQITHCIGITCTNLKKHADHTLHWHHLHQSKKMQITHCIGITCTNHADHTLHWHQNMQITHCIGVTYTKLTLFKYRKDESLRPPPWKMYMHWTKNWRSHTPWLPASSLYSRLTRFRPDIQSALYLLYRFSLSSPRLLLLHTRTVVYLESVKNQSLFWWADQAHHVW